MDDTTSPHTDIHSSDIDRGANMITIRQSKFHVVPVVDPTPINDVLGTAANRTRFRGVDQDILDSYQQAFIEFVASTPGTAEFVVDHVIPKKIGALSPEMREELLSVLQDPQRWEKEDNVATLTDPFPLDQGPFHRDAGNPGELRVLYSPHVSTKIRRGWFDFDKKAARPQYPVFVDGYDSPNPQDQPAPGSLIMFETSSGIHAQPAFSREDLQSFDGGSRLLVSTTFNFNQAIHLAQQRCAARDHGVAR
jgi:hypothetical protein